MSHDNEVENISKIIAGFVFDKVLVRPSGPKQKAEYVETQWPFFVPVAEDVIIFLLGDDYQLDGDDDEEPNARATPFVVYTNAGEC